MQNLVSMHHVSVLIILEPRISGEQANKVCRKLGFSDYFRVEAEGFSGGIWLLWNSNQIEVEAYSSQLIHV